MAGIIDDLLGSELSFLFFISITVWIGIFLYLYYMNNKLNNLKRELESLTDEQS
ncbi:MAG: CcmD family protein [Candidatus Hodarchaeales archaeon]